MAARHSRKSKKAGAIAQDSKVSEAFFHKTKLCKFFPQGACVKGASCSFAHIQNELLVPPDLYRTRMCMAFIKAGKCKDGEHCKYAHSKGELRTGTVPCSLEAGLEDSMCTTSQTGTEYELPSSSHATTPAVSLQDLPDPRLLTSSRTVTPVISLQDLPDLRSQPTSHDATPVMSMRPSHAAVPAISLQDLPDLRVSSPSHAAPHVISLQDLQDPRLKPPSHEALPVISLQDLQDSRLPPPSHEATNVISLQDQQCFATGSSLMSSPQASPNRSSTPLISMQDQPCFATGLPLPTPPLPSPCHGSTPLMSVQDQRCFTSGFGSHPGSTPYTCLPGLFDGAHMMRPVDHLPLSPVNSISPVVSPSGYATPESHCFPPPPVHASLESEEPHGDMGTTSEVLFPRKMASNKEQRAERQEDSSSKFDMYLPQINEELEHSGGNNEDYLDMRFNFMSDCLNKRADLESMSRQFSCPAGFNMSDDESEGEEDVLNDFSAQKFTRQVSAPAELYKNAFLDLKDGSDPIFHQCSGYAVSIKNTFLDFGRPQEMFGARKRRPSL